MYALEKSSCPGGCPLPAMNSAGGYSRLSKAVLRKTARERRRAIPAVSRREMSREICLGILTLPELAGVKMLMSYMAAGYEADMRAFHKAVQARGIRLCFPVCGEDGLMEAYEPEGDSAFVSGRFAISEPDIKRSALVSPEEIDMVLVPCVAFDESCNRVGQGAGYYDRFLPRCPKASFVAAAFSPQRVEKIPVDENDVPLDAIVTEEKVYRPSCKDSKEKNLV